MTLLMGYFCLKPGLFELAVRYCFLVFFILTIMQFLCFCFLIINVQKLVLFLQMQNCNKHHNHHCVHAHNCTDKSHKQQNRIKSKQSQIKIRNPQKHGLKNNRIQKQNNLSQIVQQEDGQNYCQFVDQSGYERGVQGLKRQLQKQVRRNMENQEKIAFLVQKNSQLIKKYDKNEQQNKHFVAKVQYYREQLDRIVKGSSEDIRQEIKKHLKQNMEMSLKIKHLQSALFDQQKFNGQLKQQNQSLKRQNNSLQRKIKEAYDYTQKIEAKIKKLSEEHAELKNSKQEDQRNSKAIEQRYNILALQTKNLLLDSKKNTKKYDKTIDDQQRQLNKIKNQREKQKQVQQMQAIALRKNQASILQKVQLLDQKAKRLEKQIKQEQEKNRRMQEDLLHAKNVIKKQIQLSQRNRNVDQIVKTINFERIRIGQQQTQNKQEKQNNHQSLKDTKKNANSSQLVNERTNKTQTQLYKQNQALRKQMKQIQEKFRVQIQVKEEYIMMMGASEQLKRILDEKNEAIKKLIREKGQLLSRLGF